MRRRVAGWVLPPLLLAGCTVGPDYRRPAIVTGQATAPPLLEANAAAYTAEPPAGDWWRLYESPVLDALIAKALVHNTDLRVALASLQEAQASLRSIEAQRTPQTSFLGNVTYGQASADMVGAPAALSPGPVYTLMESISYDFDLFGRLKRGIQAGAANVEAARAALDLARVNVAAQVASGYARACAAGNQIVVTNRSIALAREIVSVTQRRFAGGISGVNDTVRARALLAQTQANLPNYVAAQRAALFQIATLTGDPPERVPLAVATCTVPPVIRRPIPIGDGASLLKRRPDVREAERRLASSVADIGVATAALYPSVTLGGDLGSVATKFGDLARNRGFTWKLGPLVSWNFPNQAIARAQVREANASARGSLASFDGTVLTALRETETALSALARQLDTERALLIARDEALTAARNTERLYTGGVGEFIDTLDAERTFITADAALAGASAQVADRQVALFLALGGGWQNAPLPVDVPLDAVTEPHRRRGGKWA